LYGVKQIIVILYFGVYCLVSEEVMYTISTSLTLLSSLLYILGDLFALGVMAPDQLVNYLKLCVVHIQVSLWKLQE